MQGILIVDKPRGMTSHDVVSFVRRALKMRQVGHTGTLDPDAEGVLPVLIGKATKLSDLLSADEKSYTARVKLGVVTDTYDCTGKVLKTCPVDVTEETIKKAADSFLGRQMQVPPMYSAVKMDGKKLYQLARQGLEVERPAREVTIFGLQCFDFDRATHQFSMKIDCSKGTYIRSLCHDLGQKLGCGAAMAELIRTRSGIYTQQQSYSLETILTSAEANCVERLLISVDEALSAYPAVKLHPENAQKIRNGLRLRTNQLGMDDAKEGEYFRFYDEKDLLCLASVICDESGARVCKIEKTFFGSS